MKTQKTIAHTKQLISLALFMLVHKKNYEDISVKEICEKAGVSRMSFYRYYDRKDDIFIDFCDTRFEEFYDLYLANNENISNEEFILNMFKFFKQYAKPLQVLISAGKEYLLMEQFINYAKFLFGKNKDKTKVYQFAKVIGPFFAGGFFTVLLTWLRDGMEESPEEINRILLSSREMINPTK